MSNCRFRASLSGAQWVVSIGAAWVELFFGETMNQAGKESSVIAGLMAGAPLSGVKVLDLSRVLTGPLCSMILGDLGAEVIKVEELRIGDQTRTLSPLIAWVTRSNEGISRSGPVWPKPLIEQMTSRGFTRMNSS